MADIDKHKELAKDNKDNLKRPKSPEVIKERYPTKESTTRDKELNKKFEEQKKD